MILKSKTIKKITRCTANHSHSFGIDGFCINTRNIKSGDLFICVNGGEKFIDKAIDGGAVGAIVPKGFKDNKIPEYFPLFYVKDTYKAFVDIAKYKRKKSKAKFIAITGSVGKTGTKNMVYDVLSKQIKTYALRPSYNNDFGVPLILANIDKKAKLVITEIGMNHVGEISTLVKLIKPDVAVINNVEPVHIGNFHSLKEIAQAKAEIFEGLNGGTAIINKETNYYEVLEKKALKTADKIITFGYDKTCDVVLEKTILKEKNSKVFIEVDDKKYMYKLSIPGEHIALNSCVVFAIIKALNLKYKKAIRAFKYVDHTKGRGDVEEIILDNKRKIKMTDSSFNAGPSSMEAAIKTFSLTKKGRKILALGDMLELGRWSKRYHVDILPAILKSNIDKVYCSGKDIKYLYDKLPKRLQGALTETPEDLIPILEKELQNKDNLLVKGSHGSNMYQLAEYLKFKS